MAAYLEQRPQVEMSESDLLLPGKLRLENGLLQMRGEETWQWQEGKSKGGKKSGYRAIPCRRLFRFGGQAAGGVGDLRQALPEDGARGGHTRCPRGALH